MDVVIMGAGPAGIAAALAAADQGARVTLVEREDRPGGILKQCIHDGFGLVRYRERLTGPEYALKELAKLAGRDIKLLTETFVLGLEKHGSEFVLLLQNPVQGVFRLSCRALVAATGCRERTGRQIFIHGQRPAGVYTAGTVQRLINLEGYLPGKRAVILGSGDIGLIMARRLLLEGAEVEGVYEIKAEASGLARNLAQCLEDFDLPLHLSTTVTQVHGDCRVEGVTTARVDQDLRPLAGSERFVSCDTLVLSVGLIPENDCIESLDLEMDPATGGPVVDQNLMTTVPGLFSAGNALHVSDLVDYVSESGEIAGRAAAAFAQGGPDPAQAVTIRGEGEFLYFVPQRLTPDSWEAICWFRSRRSLEEAELLVMRGKEVLLKKRYQNLRPPEMERLNLKLSGEGPLTVKLLEVD